MDSGYAAIAPSPSPAAINAGPATIMSGPGGVSSVCVFEAAINTVNAAVIMLMAQRTIRLRSGGPLSDCSSFASRRAGVAGQPVSCWGMARMKFGAINLDVPDDWEDQSIITLVKRPNSMAGVRDLTRNFMISRAPADGSFDVDALAEIQMQSLQAALDDLQVIDEGALEIGEYSVRTREIRFSTPDKGLVQQLHAHLVHGAYAYTIVGTGSAGLAFDGLRKELLQIISSFSIE